MWLSPLKGAHLTLGQLDKTLPVDLDFIPDGGSAKINEDIERGSIVFITTGGTADGTPRFQLYTSAEAAKPNAVPYIVLTGVKDFQAGMAGNVGQAAEAQGIDKLTAFEGTGATDWFGKSTALGASAKRGPRITAISLVQPAEWQTTAYEVVGGKDYYVGEPLTVSDRGRVTHWAEGKNIVGYVTAVPKVRWINDLGASADGARISGGNAKVIEFSTAWIPAAYIADTDNDAEGAQPNVGKLDVGKPEVPGKSGKASEAAKTQGK